MQLPDSVKSPLTGRDAPLLQGVPSSRLVDGYRRSFGLDASPYFRDLPIIGIYRCDTGYCFYYPFSIAGDESLYRDLYGRPEYDLDYKQDKWEYQAALAFVRGGDKVLDVGCGEANFLVKAAEKGAAASGIEPNRRAARIARGKGIEVHEEALRAHRPGGLYDVVTAFQVLEHVPDPLSFVRSCVKVIRPGGTLVVGVPNNDSFLRFDVDNWLNQPPHHMGLWNRKSLAALAELTDLDIGAVETEPLAETDWYQSVMERRYLGRWQRRIYFRLGFAKIFAQYVRENATTIAGHTILAVYRKMRASQ